MNVGTIVAAAAIIGFLFLSPSLLVKSTLSKAVI